MSGVEMPAHRFAGVAAFYGFWIASPGDFVNLVSA